MHVPSLINAFVKHSVQTMVTGSKDCGMQLVFMSDAFGILHFCLVHMR